jgi:hypothetical protein
VYPQERQGGVAPQHHNSIFGHPCVDQQFDLHPAISPLWFRGSGDQQPIGGGERGHSADQRLCQQPGANARQLEAGPSSTRGRRLTEELGLDPGRYLWQTEQCLHRAAKHTRQP